MEQPVEDAMFENVEDDRWKMSERSLHVTSISWDEHFFQFRYRESEQPVSGSDENDPIAKEMSNLEIIDKLEAQAISMQLFLSVSCSCIITQLPTCMREISKIALQACIMNSPLHVHALESKIAEIQKLRDNVSSKHRLCIFLL